MNRNVESKGSIVDFAIISSGNMNWRREIEKKKVITPFYLALAVSQFEQRPRVWLKTHLRSIFLETWNFKSKSKFLIKMYSLLNSEDHNFNQRRKNLGIISLVSILSFGLILVYHNYSKVTSKYKIHIFTFYQLVR